MKPFLAFVPLVAGLLVAAGSVRAAGPSATPPNIVVLLADDEGWGDLGLNGNQMVKTPNIDSIGRQGAVMDRFFVCSVCAPTRAEFLTGRYHSRGGVRGVSTGLERLNTDERTIADAFKAGGYATGAFGKWHNGSQWPYHPNARGFEEYYGFTSGHWAEYFNSLVEHNGTPVRGSGYIADDLTSHALQFIEKNKAKPFFCYVPYNTPHSPWCVPDEFWNRHKDKPVPQRGNEGERENIQVTRCVLAMTENLDYNVGRVLRKLDELRLAENTIVIYFSDNGPNSTRWNGGMKGTKGSTDEGGVRSPFFIRWPGKIKPGTSVREIAGAIDLLPTLTQMAGVKRVGTKPLDGRDISPLLFGSARRWSDRQIFSHQNGNVSVRTQQYRLDREGALFDLVADPGQKMDVSAQHPEVAAKLRKAVAAWRTEVFGASAVAAAPKSKEGKKEGRAGKAAAAAMDNRPYPVGYREMPRAPLPARDGVPHGTVKRSAGAPNSSYFTSWSSPDDTMTWDIEVNETGNYLAEVYYTCPAPEVGSTLELSFNGAKVAGKITTAWDPPLNDHEDVIARSQSFMKEFKPLALGTFRLQKGRGQLALRAPQIAGKQVAEVRMVALTLQSGAKSGAGTLE
ncbi:MAG: arylsulfatase [Opitutaceae bacterium]|nr:arylsulfatase [Opitutaceae bacterium]